MKKLLFILLLYLHLFPAQRHEIGVKVGTNTIVGDIGKTNYIQIFPKADIHQFPLHLGISYKRNFNPYQGIKFSFNYLYSYSNDSDARETYRVNRRKKSSNNILEGSLTFEYNFFPINNETKQTLWSPYIFGGISGLYFDNPATNFIVTQNGTGYNITPEYLSPTKKFSWGIPFGIGIKYKFNYNWTISGEVTFRPTFTDDLDYNNIENSDYTVQYKNIPEQNLPDAINSFNQYINSNKIGNLNSKDWLNSVSIGISYSFGRPPCYCD